MINRKELKDEAKRLLDNKWGTVIGGLLLYSVLTFIAAVLNIIPIIGSIVYFVIASTLFYGLHAMHLNIANNEEIKVDNILSQGKHAINIALTSILSGIYIFLWTLLFIIPGIITAFGYVLVPFIFIENPNMQITDVLAKSKAMMRGYKFNYFILQLSFIGWAFLCIFTFGIGYLFLMPYISVTNALFYKKLKELEKEKL